MPTKSGPSMAGVIAVTGVVMLGNCASPASHGRIALRGGTPWSEVTRLGGKPTVRFSYLANGRKYDLVSLANFPNPVVFENARLFKVLPPDAIPAFERKIAGHLETVGLPFENGVGEFHAWIVAKPSERPEPVPADPVTPGRVAETVGAGVILAPVAPILLAGGLCAATEHALTGGDQTKAQAVNEALLASGPSFGTFLSQFKGFDFHTADGAYEVREYLATDGAFFTGRDFFYEVGLRNGKPLWVTYKNDAVRSHAARHWSSQQSPEGR